MLYNSIDINFLNDKITERIVVEVEKMECFLSGQHKGSVVMEEFCIFTGSSGFVTVLYMSDITIGAL
jgi:hypothetical protein